VFVDLEVDVIDAYGDVGILVAENRISWTEKEGIVGYTLQPPVSRTTIHTHTRTRTRTQA
jgi:hypothetical protein